MSGKSVAQGYWNRPSETESTFQAYVKDTKKGPFLRTGDLGFLQDGELFITGRLKDLIIIRGRNHYPQDIELTVEQSHPALRVGHGAAFTVDVDRQERLVIAQEVERSFLRNLNVNEVVMAICAAVAQQHEIQVYGILLLKTGSIPKTSSGKIQRHACRVGFLKNSLNIVSDWTANPRMKNEFQNLELEVERIEQQLQNHKSQQETDYKGGVIQNSLVHLITEYLKFNDYQIDAQEIDVNKPLVNYGLDSVTVIDLSSRLENWFGCKLSPTVLYDFQTIAVLAQHLESLQTEKLLTKIEELSDNEVDSLLQKLLKQEGFYEQSFPNPKA